mmetsp:Transcript_45487/g.176936  ORF Transcript_45487/g.176936 Transcript_45487/m.176936 type:complete len:142 (+) Transcript_45487:1041-1466(+)
MPIKPVKWMAQTSMVVRSRLTCPSQGLRGQEHPPEEVVVAGEVALVVAAVVVMAVVEVALVTEAVVVEEEDAVVAVEDSEVLEEVESELLRDTLLKDLNRSRRIARSHLGMINCIEPVFEHMFTIADFTRTRLGNYSVVYY